MLSQEMETTSWNHGNITSKEDLSLAVWLDIANINAQEKITTNIPPASDASNKAAEETSAKDKPRNKFEQMMLEDVPLLAPGVLSSMIEKSKQTQSNAANDKPRNKFEQMMLEDVPLLAPGVLSSMIEKSKQTQSNAANNKPRNKFEQMMLEDVPLLAPGVLSSMIEKSKQSQPMQQSTNPETNSKR